MSSDPIVEFFKSIASWLSFGLIGLTAVIIIIIAYLILKTKSVMLIIIFMIFCGGILVFFTYAGVGLVKENKVLQDSTKALVQTANNLETYNNDLTTRLKISDSKFQIANASYELKTNNISHVDSLSNKINVIAMQIDTLKNNDPLLNTAKATTLSIRFKNIATQLDSNNISKTQAMSAIESNTKLLNELIKTNNGITSLH